MAAMIAAPDMNIDSNWYPDSGATNHLTHSLSNLSTGADYNGGNQIYAVNGSGLPILYYGSLHFNLIHHLFLQNLWFWKIYFISPPLQSFF